MLDSAAGVLLAHFSVLREAAGLTPEELDKRLILGPGWVRRFESGETIPSLDVLLVMLAAIGTDLADLVDGMGDALRSSNVTVAAVDRFMSAAPAGGDLAVSFRYAKHDATYVLPGATLEEFEAVIKVMRDGLALLATAKTDDPALKSDAVARAYLLALQLWPEVNPSDLWWFVVMRAYCDPFNHPASFARLDFAQSWKRTGGWALEEVLVRVYGPALAEDGIRLFIATTEQRQHFINGLTVSDRLEADKMDVLLVGEHDGRELCFGVVHVKASFAERRTDDVPMSKALVEGGYCSPLWTMDCKSTPTDTPVNRGELGSPAVPGAIDSRSAKRKDIEEDGYFSACFSYNHRTEPTPATQSARAKIITCDFTDPTDDPFSRFIRAEWDRFQRLL